MPSYSWSCLVCEAPNPAGSEICSFCGCPANVRGMEIAARRASLHGGAIVGHDDDLERLKEYGYKKSALNVVAYTITGVLAVLALNYIPEDVDKDERWFYYSAFFVAAFILGHFVNWLVKIVFHEDISK